MCIKGFFMLYFHSIVILLSCLLFVHQTTLTVFDGVRSFFGGTPYHDVVEKDYALDAFGTINVQNIEGSITVRPGLDKRSVALRATKYSNTQEHLEHMHVIEEESSHHRLSLRSTYDYEGLRGHIDYLLTVPESVSLQLSTQTGIVHITGIKGDVNVILSKGDVTIVAADGVVHATITQQGDIIIVDPKKAVHVQQHKGQLYVTDSHADVHATLQQGNMHVQARHVSENTRIELIAGSGDIKLKLPKVVNASLHATTERGVVTSQQKIIISEQQAQLGGTYWSSVKKNVHGRCGDEQKSHIELVCKQGNIRLKER